MNGPGTAIVRAPLRVLVADDNPVVRAGLTALLSGRDDIEVVADAADGWQAYEAAVRTRPDVILLDVRMPGYDGMAALPHLARLASVLMMTYSREGGIVREALRLGADGYLVHGEFTVEQLVTAVHGVHEGRPHLTPSAAGALLDALRGGQLGATGEGTDAAHGGSVPAHERGRDEGPSAGSRYTPFDPVSQVAVGQRSATTPSQGQAHVGHSSAARHDAGAPLRAGLSRREVEIMDLIASGMTNQQIAAACFISHKTVKNHINRIFTKVSAGSRGEAIALWNGATRGGSRTHD